MRNVGRKAAWPILLMAGLSSAQACLSFDTYCQEKVDCQDGNEKDVEACVVAEEAGADIADLYGCTDELELFAECREKDATCVSDQYILENNDCNDERDEYSSCLGDNLPGSPF